MNDIKNLKFFVNLQIRQIKQELGRKQTTTQRQVELEKLLFEMTKSKVNALTFFRNKEIAVRNAQYASLISELKDEKILNAINPGAQSAFSISEISFLSSTLPPKKRKK
jgi:hypothetical protein